MLASRYPLHPLEPKPVVYQSRAWFKLHHAQKTTATQQPFKVNMKKKKMARLQASVKCAAPTCDSVPQYNYATEKKPMYCKEHKLEEMVTTKLRHRYINRQTNSQTVYHKTNDDKFVEGSDYKDDCALNVLVNGSRKLPGRCEHYQDKPVPKEVKIKTYCEGCKKMMHPDCYWIYHDVHLGLRLHTLDYVNEQRAKISSMMSSTEI